MRGPRQLLQENLAGSIIELKYALANYNQKIDEYYTNYTKALKEDSITGYDSSDIENIIEKFYEDTETFDRDGTGIVSCMVDGYVNQEKLKTKVKIARDSFDTTSKDIDQLNNLLEDYDEFDSAVVDYGIALCQELKETSDGLAAPRNSVDSYITQLETYLKISK